MNRVVRLVAVLYLCGLVAAIPAKAQTASTGKLSGTVTDPSGAVIPGATIVVKDQGTNLSRTVTTDAQGLYNIPLLPPGNWSVEVSAAGFSKVVAHVTIDVSQSSTLPIQMTVGQTQQVVTVSGGPELLQTDSAVTGQVVEQDEVQSFPLVARNFTQILGLSAGVSMAVTNATDVGRGSQSSESPYDGGGKNVHGSRPDDNNFQINGIEVNDQIANGEIAGTGIDLSGGLPIPNPDTIQEFKEQTAQFDASYGRNAGGQIDIITRGGSNQVHGSVWEFFRNEALNANDYFRNLAQEPRGLLRQNQYGGVIGGPIVRDHLYYFGSYQGTEQLNGVAAACSASVFSPLLTDDRSPAALGALFGGESGALGGVQVAGNGSNISPLALELMQYKLLDGQYLFPTPQTSLNGQGFSSFSTPCPYSENQAMANLDYTPSNKSVFSARLFWLGSSETVTFDDTNIPGFPVKAFNSFWVSSFAHTYTINSRMVNQATFGVNSTAVQELVQPPLSWTSLDVPVPVQGNTLFATEIIGSYNASNQVQQSSGQENFNFVDLLSYTRGQHSLRFGGGLSRVHLNPGVNEVAPWPEFLSFPDFLLGLPACPAGTYPATCNVTTPGASNGTPFSNEYGAIVFSSQGGRQFRQWNYNAFAQDDWKAFRNVTFNFGLRYEKFGTYSDELGRESGFNPQLANPTPPASGTFAGFYVNNNYPASAVPLPAGVLRLSNDGPYNGNNENTFAPRVGFAWQVKPQFVVRGGYALYYSTQTAFVIWGTKNSQPFGNTTILFGAANAAQSWTNPFPTVAPPSSLPIWTPYSPTTALSEETAGFDFQPALTQLYVLNTQTGIGKNFVLEVGYTGARATHLFQATNADPALFATPADPIRGATTNTLANVSQRLVIQGFTPGGITVEGTEGASWYNALDVTLSKRLSKGLQFQAAYTFSKILDTAAVATGTNGANPGNPLTPFRYYGLADYDRPHRLAVSYVYEFPQITQKSQIENIFINGWQVSGVTIVQSGTPLTPQVTSASNYAGTTGDVAEVASGCNLVTPGSIRNKLTNYFNKSCILPFPVVDPSGTTGYGNGPIAPVFGPGQFNFDISLQKTTGVPFLGEAAKIQFRADFFNAFNHPQFSNPGTTANSPTSFGSFGQITSTSVNPRVIQFALKYVF
jgi:hypothetical protein